MLSEILLETLSFLDRASLESCQLVNRSYLGTITKSNAAFALRPMDVLVVRCIRAGDSEDRDFVRFVRLHSTRLEDAEVQSLRTGTDSSQLLAATEKVVARTRNMCIDRIDIMCVACASPLIALWRDTFDDRMPSSVVELSMRFNCSTNRDTSLHQLFQPFASSKLGVLRYEMSAWDEDERTEFDALWSAWNSPTAQFATFNLHGVDLLPYFLEQLLREREHGGRHYTVNGDSLEVVEQYLQKFEFGSSELNFPTSLAFYRFQTQDGSLHKLRRLPLQTLDKPPNSSVPYPESLRRRSRRIDFTGHVVEESRCDVYKIHNVDRRQTMYAYFWVATKRLSFNTGATEDHYYQCHWFNVVPF